MNVLLVNWQDLENPQAGGAEIHLFEIFSRLAGGRAPGAAGLLRVDRRAPERANVRGIEVQRVGRRNSFALLGRGAVRRAIRRGAARTWWSRTSTSCRSSSRR